MRPSILLVTLLALGASGCYARARVAYRATVPSQVVVAEAPPPLHDPVAPPPAPTADAVWVAGYWKWEGRWEWQPGQWERGRTGYVWVAPVADTSGGDVVYHPGYWCPEDEAPAPVYRNPGTVRVSVRPTATVTARTSGGATVTTRTSGGGTVTARPATGGTVTARPAGGGTVTARPATGGTVTARPAGGGTVTARPATGGGTVTARPADDGRTPTTTARSAGGTVTARTGVNRADPSVRTGQTPSTGGSTGGTTTVRAPTATRPPSATGGRTVTTTPTVTRRDPPNGGGTATADRPGATTPTDGPPQVRGEVTVRPGQAGALQCSLETARAPLNGIIVVRGSFASNARVLVGGSTATIVTRRSNMLQARVPGSSGGGQVTVTQGNDSASCGRLVVER